MYVLMYYRAPNVYVCNNATTSLHIHIFGVAAGMCNSTTMRFNFFILFYFVFLLLLSSLFFNNTPKIVTSSVLFIFKKNFLDALSLKI